MIKNKYCENNNKKIRHQQRNNQRFSSTFERFNLSKPIDHYVYGPMILSVYHFVISAIYKCGIFLFVWWFRRLYAYIVAFYLSLFLSMSHTTFVQSTPQPSDCGCFYYSHRTKIKQHISVQWQYQGIDKKWNLSEFLSSFSK